MASCCSMVDHCCRLEVNKVPVVGKFSECAEYMNEYRLYMVLRNMGIWDKSG